LALLFDKLQRGGRGSRQIKLDGLTPSVMEQWALAAQVTRSVGPHQLAGCGRNRSMVFLAW